MTFGVSVKYEQLDGTASGEIDPNDRHQKRRHSGIEMAAAAIPRHVACFDGFSILKADRHQPRQPHDSLRTWSTRQQSFARFHTVERHRSGRRFSRSRRDTRWWERWRRRTLRQDSR